MTLQGDIGAFPNREIATGLAGFFESKALRRSEQFPQYNMTGGTGLPKAALAVKLPGNYRLLLALPYLCLANSRWPDDDADADAIKKNTGRDDLVGV